MTDIVLLKTFVPQEYSNSREFLDDLQKWLELHTRWIFKDRYIRSFGKKKWDQDFEKKWKSATPNEPEDRYTLALQDSETYFWALQKASKEWENQFQEGMKLAFELAKWDPSEALRIYFLSVARIYAMRAKVWNKASEEKLIEKIVKELLKRAPYYQHAFSTLLNAQNGFRMPAVRKMVREAVEKIVWKDTTRGGVITPSFWWANRGKIITEIAWVDVWIPKSADIEPSEEEKAKYEALLKIVENKMDAEKYVEMLLEPINLHSQIKEQTLIKISRNPGFQSLCTILKDLLWKYEEDPKEMLKVGDISAILRLLGNIEAIAKTASVIDSYEKKANQYALVFLCQRLIRELSTFFNLYIENKLPQSPQGIEELLPNLLWVSKTIDRLSWKDMPEDTAPPHVINISSSRLGSIVEGKEMMIEHITPQMNEDDIRRVVTLALAYVESGVKKWRMASIMIDSSIIWEQKQKILAIIEAVKTTSTQKDKKFPGKPANDSEIPSE
jgi:hypothetical protein